MKASKYSNFYTFGPSISRTTDDTVGTLCSFIAQSYTRPCFASMAEKKVQNKHNRKGESTDEVPSIFRDDKKKPVGQKPAGFTFLWTGQGRANLPDLAVVHRLISS